MAKNETPEAPANNAPEPSAQVIPAAPPEPTEAELIERRKRMLKNAGIIENE